MRSDAKTREMRLRNKAKRLGLRVEKSCRRDPDAPDFGLYWLIDAHGNYLVETGDLDNIEAYLRRTA